MLSWVWIVVGLIVLALLFFLVALVQSTPRCLTCGRRIHARWCAWRAP